MLVERLAVKWDDESTQKGFDAWVRDHDIYPKVTFSTKEISVNLDSANESIKNWVRRSSHGYMLEKMRGYTSIIFLLNRRRGEGLSAYLGRCIKQAISFYKNYEPVDDPYILYHL
jgi:hypothetical protein